MDINSAALRARKNNSLAMVDDGRRYWEVVHHGIPTQYATADEAEAAYERGVSDETDELMRTFR